MKGKIIIDAWGDNNCSITVDMEHMSNMNKLVIMDGMIDALKLDEEACRVIGGTIFRGGIKNVIGHAPTKITVDLDAIENLKKENNNETDAL